MSLAFIPTIWSARLLMALHKALVYSQAGVVNKDYEGEIKAAGNTVKIGTIGAITVGTYTVDTDMAAAQTLTDSEQSLLIDQSKYFNFQVDDVSKAQQNVNAMDAAMTEAAYAIRSEQDAYVATAMDAAVPAGNKIGTVAVPIVPTSASAYENLVDLSTLLDENDAPEMGRFCIVPPWFHGLLQKDDRFVKAGTAATDAVLRNGQIGQAAGLTVFTSNNVPNTAGAKYKIIAGHTSATTVAEQILSVEKYRLEKRFADGVKGLHVYGAKVIRPTLLAELIASKS